MCLRSGRSRCERVIKPDSGSQCLRHLRVWRNVFPAVRSDVESAHGAVSGVLRSRRESCHLNRMTVSMGPSCPIAMDLLGRLIKHGQRCKQMPGSDRARGDFGIVDAGSHTPARASSHRRASRFSRLVLARVPGVASTSIFKAKTKRNSRASECWCSRFRRVMTRPRSRI